MSSEPMKNINIGDLNGTIATVPNGNLDQPLLVRVGSVRETPLAGEAPVVTVYDRNGNPIELNVWAAHSLGVDWRIDDWYVLDRIRGLVWKTEEGELQKQLITTEETKVHHLGQSVSPEPVAESPVADISVERTYEKALRNHQESESGELDNNEPSDGTHLIDTAEEGSILDEINDEFNF